MFVKIVRKEPGGYQESTYECDCVHMTPTDIGMMFSMEGTGITCEDVPTHDLKEGVTYSVYLMNNQGHTIDSYQFG